MQISAPLLPGEYYHIYNRGNQQENIFLEERNYAYFLRLYVKYIAPVADTYAYCLLRNHFHLLVQIKPTPNQVNSRLNPANQFSNLFNSYAKAINKAYQRTGSLFQRRFSRKLITSNQYFVHLLTYIHLNPQKHGFTSDYRTYPYSSYQIIRSQGKSWLRTTESLAWFGDLTNFEAYHLDSSIPKSIAHLIEDDEFI